MYLTYCILKLYRGSGTLMLDKTREAVDEYVCAILKRVENVKK